MNKRGFAAMWVVLAMVIVLIVAGGIWYWKSHENISQNDNSSNTATSGTTQTPTATSTVTAITIPTTTSTLAVMAGDSYGLLMTDPKYAEYGYSGSVLDDGLITNGPYQGYHRVLVRSHCFGQGDCYFLLFATKDYQSFILDNSANLQGELGFFAGWDLYLNPATVSGQASIPFAFPETIATDGVVLNNNDDYATSSVSEDQVPLPSLVSGLDFFFNPQSYIEATSSDNSDAQNNYLATEDQYVSNLSADVTAEDTNGVMTEYSVTSPDFSAGENLFSGIATGTALYSAYGQEGCEVEGYNPWYVLKNVSDGDLVQLGTDASGTILYSLKDPNHPLNQAVYYEEVLSAQDFSYYNNGIPAPSFDDFVAKHPILIIKDPFGRLLASNEIQYNYTGDSCDYGKKPVIYLYPPKPTDVTVQFASPIDLSLSIPTYKGKWDVLAQPDGALQDLQPQLTDCTAIDSTALGSEYAQTACEKNDYPYLYWAGYFNKPFPHLSDGWVVPQNGIQAFLEKELTDAGLNQKEKDDMISYWVPELSKINAPYYRLSFLQTNQMNALVPLNITPKPDTEFRIFLVWLPLDAMPSVQPEPEPLQPLVRKGFTVVEWGGGEE